LRTGSITFVAAAFAVGACNAVPTVALTPRVGPSYVDGEIGASSAGAGSTSADSFGLDEDPGVLAPRIDASWVGLDAWASWFDARFAGSGVTEDQIDLGGAVLGSGEPTDADVEILLGTSGLVYDFVPGDAVDLGLGLGLGYVDFDARFDSQLSATSVRASQAFELPLLAGRAAFSSGDFCLSLVAAGLSTNANGDDLSVLDADLMLRWSFLAAGPMQGSIVVGYRATSVAARYDDGGSTVEAELSFQGPYAGLSLQL
jgi:hypothetical protein